MLEEYALLISAVALLVSVANFFLYYKQIKKTTGAGIQHELTNLPPYHSKEEKTTIKVKNIGNAVANIESTNLYFSWNADLILDLDYGCEEDMKYFLVPNEEKVFHQKLPEPPETGTCAIAIITEYDGNEKMDEFPISARKRVFI